MKEDTALGAVFTPPWLVARMVAMAQPDQKSTVLEPGCAHAPFLQEFASQYGTHHELVGVEIDEERLSVAKQQLPQAHLIHTDFLLWDPTERFDIIIGNPPYGIIGDKSHYPIQLVENKPIYKARSHTWRGKYNVYGLFVEHALQLLKPNGKLVFVIPATWMILDEFKLLRQYLSRYRVEVYYLGNVFPKRNVSVCILKVQQGKGLTLYDETQRPCPEGTGDLEPPLFRRNSGIEFPLWAGDLVRFITEEWQEFEGSGVPLGSLFEIQFAARSTQIRSHPLTCLEPRNGRVPVLTGRNLKPGVIDYETCYSGMWFPRSDVRDLREVYGIPHIVVAHTKGTRVVAAVDWRCYPWREEFHLRHLRDIDLEMTVRYLNSGFVQNYIRCVYRDIVPHLTLEMLKRIPIHEVCLCSGPQLTLDM